MIWGHPFKGHSRFWPDNTAFRHIYGRLPWLPDEDFRPMSVCSKTNELRESLRFWWREHLATLSHHEIVELASAGVGEEWL